MKTKQSMDVFGEALKAYYLGDNEIGGFDPLCPPSAELTQLP